MVSAMTDSPEAAAHSRRRRQKGFREKSQLMGNPKGLS